MRPLLLALVFLLTGCSTLVGHSKNDLIRQLGIPAQSMETDQGTLYQYVNCDYDFVTVPLDGPLGHMEVNTGASCKKRLFVIKDDKVVSDRVIK